MHPNGSDVYWVAWSAVTIRQAGDHRLRVTPARWDKLDVGTEIEVIWVSGDRTPDLRDGMFVSAGNLTFPMIMVVLMGGIAIVIVIRLARRKFSSTVSNQ